MIRIVKCKKEARQRDKKFKRLLLIIGNKKIHITQREAYILCKDILRYADWNK